MKNFDLRVSDHDGQTIRVAVTHSAAGDVAPVQVEAPSLTAFDLVETPDAELRAIAADFSAQVMPGPVWQAWRESWAAAGDEGIRLRIRCEEARGVAIPWELLYDAERRYFLARDPRSAVVRYLEGPIADATKPIEEPLRLLLTSASPTEGLDKLEVGKELDGIEAALAKAKEAGRVEITRLDALTLDALDRALLEVRPHLFHFSGHGQWDESQGAGRLLLDDGAGRRAELADDMLAMLLRNRGVALVLLNACETAVGGDGWAGLAQSLVLARIPAVVAMQIPVTDGTATAFAGTLYAGLANNYTLEEAVTLARQSTARLGDDVAGPGEWLAPALFMRTGSEQFWQADQPEPPDEQKAQQAQTGGITIDKIEAANVGETQIIDQRGADISVGDKQIDTGGGAYVGGNVTVSGGDFVGRDKIVTRQGKGAAGNAFGALAASMALQASPSGQGRATKLVAALQQAVDQGDDDSAADCIGDLAGLVPDAVADMKRILSNPPLSDRLGPATKYVVRRL